MPMAYQAGLIDVQPHSARVLMIADINHAMPGRSIQWRARHRSGHRLFDGIELIYVPATADIILGIC